jgi:hypothetical protein
MTIANVTQLKTWASTGGTGTLTANITITASPDYPLNMVNGCILDGNGYKITIPSGETDALFKVGANSTVTVKDLEVEVLATTMTTGVLFAAIATNSVNITVTDCAITGTGTFTMSTNKAGIVAGIDSGVQNYTVSITGCYCTGNIGIDGGGIFGINSSTQTSGNVVIDKCYSLGIIGAGGGGIAGRGFGNAASSNKAIIRRCYSLGAIANTSGGICGSNCGVNSGNVLISNCYSIGTITSAGAGIIGVSGGNGCTIQNCYARRATATGKGAGQIAGNSSGNPSILSCEVGGSSSASWGATLGTSLLDDQGSPNTDIWLSAGSFSTGFGLTRFKLSPWDGTTYANQASQPDFTSAGGGGDPHITTINNETYYLITKGTFNLFDNNNEDARLVINADVFIPEYPIWNDKEYINNIYINYKGDCVIINAGFRGKLTEIINIDDEFNFKENSNITINEFDLELCNDHKMFCSECKYRTRNINYLNRHKINTNHNVLKNIRNKINVIISDEYNNYNITISNVNSNNFNPSNISIKIKDKTKCNKYSGAIIKKHENYECDIENLKYIKLISNNIE